MRGGGFIDAGGQTIRVSYELPQKDKNQKLQRTIARRAGRALVLRRKYNRS
jgi:hypothetical protein